MFIPSETNTQLDTIRTMLNEQVPAILDDDFLRPDLLEKISPLKN